MQYMRPEDEDVRRYTQLLKGALDLCILALLQDGPLYGYAVVDALNGRGLDLVAEGSIYPLLTRMEKAGACSSYKAPSPEGPPRKYYKITPQGERELRSGVQQWEHINSVLGTIFTESSTAKQEGRAR